MTEAQLLQIKMSDWIMQVNIVKAKGIVALEQVKQQLEQIQTVDDIRYSYFNKVYVGSFMMLESETETYEQLIQRFLVFTQGTLNYYLSIHTDKAFEGDMEMLPDEARAATMLFTMFERKEDEWEQKIQDLRKACEYYPPLHKNAAKLERMIKELLQQG